MKVKDLVEQRQFILSKRSYELSLYYLCPLDFLTSYHWSIKMTEVYVVTVTIKGHISGLAIIIMVYFMRMLSHRVFTSF